MRESLNAAYVLSGALVAFLLHLVWENAQAPLYAGYQSFVQHIPICLKGTMGDVALTLFAVALVWLPKRGRPRTAADFLALAIIGFLIAVVIEQRAMVAGAWSYAPAMPIVPWLDVGVAPVLQMTLLLPLTWYVAGLLDNAFHAEFLHQSRRQKFRQRSEEDSGEGERRIA